MIGMSGQPTSEVVQPINRTRRWPRRLLILILALAVVFYGGGGWYFSSLLESDALMPVTHEPAYEVEVRSIDEGSITLAAESGSERALSQVPAYGLATPDGRIRLGAVSSFTVDGDRDVATRPYQLVDGETPAAGDFGDLDGWVYPDDVRVLFPAATEVTLASDVGALPAWYMPGDGDTWTILIHGRTATTRETLRLAAEIGSGPILSMAYRNDPGAPLDPSGYYRFGATEWRDVDAAVTYAIEHGAERVVLGGLSTGAALSLSFLYRSDLSDRVVGLIFDSPNIDFSRTVDFGASQRELPGLGLPVPQSLATVAKLIGSWRFGVDWDALDYIDDADQIDVPVLVFHGTADTTVPLDVSERLAAARPDIVELVVVDGAEHVESWNMDPARYGDAVRRFLASLEA